MLGPALGPAKTPTSALGRDGSRVRGSGCVRMRVTDAHVVGDSQKELVCLGMSYSEGGSGRPTVFSKHRRSSLYGTLCDAPPASQARMPPLTAPAVWLARRGHPPHSSAGGL